jgi:hypothetical protein
MQAAERALVRWVTAVFLVLAVAGCGGGASIGFYGSDFDDDSVYLDPVSQSWLGTWTGTLALGESTQSASCPVPMLSRGPAQTVTITAHRDGSLHVAFSMQFAFDTTPWFQPGAGPYQPGDLVITTILPDGSNATWHLRKVTAASVQMIYSQVTPVAGVPGGCLQRWSGTLNRLP